MATQRLRLLLFPLLLGGCFQQDKVGTSELLPPNYQTSYVQVRSCRLNVGHNSDYTVVYANADADSAYLAGNYPLPQRSTIVAVESGQADCSGPTGYTLMFKDVQGYNPAQADWHWQRLDDQYDVLQDGRIQECMNCHASCSQYDYTCSH